MKQALDALKKIKVFVFDIDGVLTDGSVGLLPDGTQMRTMNVKDGFGLEYAVKKGYHIVVISKGNSPESEKRLRLLGVQQVHINVKQKLPLLTEVLQQLHCTQEEAVYVGDDIPDLECMDVVGYSCCPSDAVEEVKTRVDYIIPVTGGRGVARHILKRVLAAQGNWDF
ncbi:MAG: HAD hydrolase family protein [Chitinophagaceae bacterium]